MDFPTLALVYGCIYCLMPGATFAFLLFGFGLRSEAQQNKNNAQASLWRTFLILGFVSLACAIGGILWMVL
jgi:hypothetical protein